MSTTIRTMEARMPPGFRFHPRDTELVLDYLLQKLTTGHTHGGGHGVAMVDVDLNKCEPWELPEESCVGGKRSEWYFFSLRGRKYSTGDRTDRATRSGYWKATGKDRAVVAGGGEKGAAATVVVGIRKTLVFYRGRAPRGRKTEWVMHEFRLQPQLLLTSKEDWVLCRVFLKCNKSRTTTTTGPPRPPPPSGGAGHQACSMPSYCEPDHQPAAPGATCSAFDSSRVIVAAEQVPSFAGLLLPPTTAPFRRPPVSLLGGLSAGGDIPEKQEAMGVMDGSTMTSTVSFRIGVGSGQLG